MAQGNDIVPIPGTKRQKYLRENIAAANVELSHDVIARLNSEVPKAAGARYADMSTVNH